MASGKETRTKVVLARILGKQGHGSTPVPPPSSGLLREVVREYIPEGNNGGSDKDVHQDRFLDEFIFKGEMKGGFFVEAGADDFLLNTNTLLFELLHGWTGLLVEPLLRQFQEG